MSESYKGDYEEELLALNQQLELLQARKELLMKKMENQEETHMEGGLHFTVLWSTKGTMHYHSFDELGLKDCSDRDLVISGFKRNLETIPISIGFFCVGDTLFMAGGRIGIGVRGKLEPTNCLWYAVPPTDGSLCESWTLSPATMKVKRSLCILVPLHDGRIFICGGTTEQEGWAELYDPEKGEFDVKNLSVDMGKCPRPIKGGDYFATVQMKGVLKVGPFSHIYVFADKDKKGKEKNDDRQVNGRLC